MSTRKPAKALPFPASFYSPAVQAVCEKWFKAGVAPRRIVETVDRLESFAFGVPIESEMPLKVHTLKDGATTGEPTVTRVVAPKGARGELSADMQKRMRERDSEFYALYAEARGLFSELLHTLHDGRAMMTFNAILKKMFIVGFSDSTHTPYHRAHRIPMGQLLRYKEIADWMSEFLGEPVTEQKVRKDIERDQASRELITKKWRERIRSTRHRDKKSPKVSR